MNEDACKIFRKLHPKKRCLSRNCIIFVKSQDFKGYIAIDVLYKKEHFIYMSTEDIQLSGIRDSPDGSYNKDWSEVTLTNLSLSIHF